MATTPRRGVELEQVLVGDRGRQQPATDDVT